MSTGGRSTGESRDGGAINPSVPLSPAVSPALTAVPPADRGSSLFDLVSSEPAQRERQEFLADWLAESDPIRAIVLWLNSAGIRPQGLTAAAALRRLNLDIGRIDRLLETQLNAVLHTPKFQKLEASWRGLKYLVNQVEPDANCKIRVLSLSWTALARDQERAIEFDQSQLFRKIYSEEFGTSGGEPYSVIIGDYEIRLRPGETDRTDDVATLKSISQVAAAAFTPFIAGAHPSLFGLDNFLELERPADLPRLFSEVEYTAWNALRKHPDARFLALTVPRILLRKPYAGRGMAAAEFPFRETLDADQDRDYLWGNGAFALGGVILRSFCQNGWLADIRGVRQDRQEGGLVNGLPEVSCRTDRAGMIIKPPLDVALSAAQEADFSNLGFTAMCPCDITGLPAFYSTPTLQKPEIYEDKQATLSARLSTMLHYMLCVSRIAHYVKVLGREKIGSYTEPADCEEYLNDWLRKYVTQDDDASAEVKARYPLREAEATIRERPGEPGNYYCTIYLQPHYQMDDMVSAVKLTTELSPLRSN